jgi:hypothetical protein
LVCNNTSIYHDRNCPSHKNNSLKGAAVNQQPTKQYLFNSDEVNLLGKSLQICRYVITKNQAQYQNPQDILKEISTSISIISARKNNKNNNSSSNLKGASSNICNKQEHLTDLLKLFGLT